MHMEFPYSIHRLSIVLHPSEYATGTANPRDLRPVPERNRAPMSPTSVFRGGG